MNSFMNSLSPQDEKIKDTIRRNEDSARILFKKYHFPCKISERASGIQSEILSTVAE